MNAFLLILKVTGIVLLFLLAVLLVLLMIVLLVPVRYRLAGHADRENKEYLFELRFGWLLGVIRGTMVFPSENPVSVYVLKKRLVPSENVSPDPEEQKEPEQEFSQESFYDKIIKISEKSKRWLQILTQPETEETLRSALSEMLGILKKLFPRKYHISGCFGGGSPDQTGEILSIVSMLWPVIGDHVQIFWDFEKEVLQLEFDAAGRLRAGSIAAAALRLILNKNCRILAARIRNRERG